MPRQNRREQFWATPKGGGHDTQPNDTTSESGVTLMIGQLLRPTLTPVKVERWLAELSNYLFLLLVS
jgi:hypothetical protein